MFLVRYFLYAGSALLALLFLVNWYAPAAPTDGRPIRPRKPRSTRKSCASDRRRNGRRRSTSTPTFPPSFRRRRWSPAFRRRRRRRSRQPRHRANPCSTLMPKPSPCKSLRGAWQRRGTGRTGRLLRNSALIRSLRPGRRGGDDQLGLVAALRDKQKGRSADWQGSLPGR